FLLRAKDFFFNQCAVGRRSRQPERAIQFINATIGIDPMIRFSHPSPIHQRGFAFVARLGRDGHQRKMEEWSVGVMEGWVPRRKPIIPTLLYYVGLPNSGMRLSFLHYRRAHLSAFFN